MGNAEAGHCLEGASLASGLDGVLSSRQMLCPQRQLDQGRTELLDGAVKFDTRFLARVEGDLQIRLSPFEVQAGAQTEAALET
jgi:hypothetical protein